MVVADLGALGASAGVAIVLACLPLIWLNFWLQLQVGLAPWPLLALLEIGARDVRQFEDFMESMAASPLSASKVRELSTKYMQLHGRLRSLSSVAGNGPGLLLAGGVIQSIGILLLEFLLDPIENRPNAGLVTTGVFLGIMSPTLVAFITMAWLGRRCDQLGSAGIRLLSNLEGAGGANEVADCTDLLLRYTYTVQAVPTGWFIGRTRAGPSFVLRACLSAIVSVLKKSWSFCFPDDWDEGKPKLGTALFAAALVIFSGTASVMACLRSEVEEHGSQAVEAVELPTSHVNLRSQLVDPARASTQVG